MSRKILLVLGILVILVGIVGSSALFTVHQTQQAIVMQFGEPKRVISEPGLSWKVPFIQDVLYYERRVLNLDPPTERLLLSDQKPLLVDAFARYRIKNPLVFFQTVRTEGVVRQRLGGIINASLREVLGRNSLTTVLSAEREALLEGIRSRVDAQAQRFGIDILDVRIRRTDLPEEISQAVYDRMKTERLREAREFRAQGDELALRIRAAADREATVIVAEATREAEMLRGEGEGRRTEILNEAYGQDPDFFNFYRSMQAYEQSLADEGTYMVLSPDSEFFSFFNSVESSLKPNEETAGSGN